MRSLSRTTCDRRKHESCFRVLIPFGEMVMPNERLKDKSKVLSCVGIILGLLDRSDEAGVVGTSRDRTYMCCSAAQ